MLSAHQTDMLIPRIPMLWGIAIFFAQWLALVGVTYGFRGDQLELRSKNARLQRPATYTSPASTTELVTSSKSPNTSSLALSLYPWSYSTNIDGTDYFEEGGVVLHDRYPQKRQDEEPTKSFDQCTKTGANIINAIKCQRPVQQKWNNFSELRKNGYSVKNEAMEEKDLTQAIKSLANDLKISLEGWMEWTLVHDTLDSKGDKRVEFDFVTHAEAGVIVVLCSFGPKNPQVDGGPPLDKPWRLSDVAFLCLLQHAKTLKIDPKFAYYVVKDVLNRSAQLRLVDVLQASKTDQVKAAEGKWPGYSLSMDAKQEEKGEGTLARALLGTPSGLAAGYILLDRQHIFPKRTIKAVTVTQVVSDTSAKDPNKVTDIWTFDLLVTIQDLPDKAKREVINPTPPTALIRNPALAVSLTVPADVVPPSLPGSFKLKGSSQFRRRQSASEKSWDDCLKTGKNILAVIECQGKRPQKYSEFEEFRKAGYSISKEQYDPRGPFNFEGILTSLKLPLVGWLVYHIQHSTLRSSLGYVTFDLITNADVGAIIIKNSYGAMNPQPNGKKLDVLYRLSDIAFLVMQQHAKDAEKDLKFNYYIVGNIANSGTAARSLDILQASTQQQREAAGGVSPGYVMNIDGDQDAKKGEGTFARVLLGTPSGLAAGYILTDRQPSFPGRTIKSLAILETFIVENGDEPDDLLSFSLVITIKDLPKKEGGDPKRDADHEPLKAPAERDPRTLLRIRSKF